MVEAYTVKALSPVRKIIAARMLEAKRSIPHFRLGMSIDVDALLALRRELQVSHPCDKLSLNDFLIKACAAALMEVPEVNVQWADNAIHEYGTADISVVAAVSGGLSTPVLRGADSKSIWEISREIKELVSRARRNALKMDEIVGGSFSLSNLGMYGIDDFDAIINPPQCAILAVGAAAPTVLVSPDREIRAATVLRATLSADHRAIDGATGALFLSALRRRMEHPEQLIAPGGTDGAVGS
jgi:pyruvate dehydrogenase E2 component (dihydrolipoamide acetyltransferase)